MKINIIGGGLAGLTAAVYGARAGHEVTLFEKSRSLGGRARTRTDAGYCLNIGPHALYRSGAAAAILQELGVTFTGGPPKQRGYLGLNGKRVPMSRPFGLGLFRPASLFDIARLFLALKYGTPGNYAGVTLTEWLKDASPEAKALIEMLTRIMTYTDAPDMIGMDAVMDQFQRYIQGNVLYLDGGWGSLVDQLHSIAECVGALVLTGARVERVQDTTVCLADGRAFPADVVILATAPDVVRQLMPDVHLPQMCPSYMSTLDVALSALPDPGGIVSFELDTPYYLVVHSASAEIAPPGGAVVHVAKCLAPGAPPAERAELETFLEQAQPGWRKHVVTARFLPRMTVSNSIVTGYADRPGVRLKERVFLAGDWVGAEGQLADAALASARKAIQLMSEVSVREQELQLG